MPDDLSLSLMPSLTRSALLKRGWTNKLIAALLGEPQIQSGPGGGRLYALERVLEAERSEAFVRSRKRAAPQTSNRQTSTRKHQLQPLPLEYAEAFQIRFASAPPELQPGEAEQRRVVNLLRAQTDGYFQKLRTLPSKAGLSSAIALMEAKVYAAIAWAHPSLSPEVRRQWRHRHGASRLLEEMIGGIASGRPAPN
jgi:hypothetical protein